MEEFKSYWQRWSDFAGTSTRREYWIVFLINFVISAVLTAPQVTMLTTISSIYGAVCIIPGLAIATRRLHEVGKSGWYLLWLLLPVIGWIMVIVALASPATK